MAKFNEMLELLHRYVPEFDQKGWSFAGEELPTLVLGDFGDFVVQLVHTEGSGDALGRSINFLNEVFVVFGGEVSNAVETGALEVIGDDPSAAAVVGASLQGAAADAFRRVGSWVDRSSSRS